MARNYSTPTSDGPITAKVLHSLEENGYAVIKDYLDLETCEQLKQRWLSVMAHYKCGFDPEDHTTWKSANLPKSTRGMQDYPPIAQQAFVWEARILCAPIFAALWGCKVDELITSMDRICFVPKTMLTRKSPSWWHLDQAKKDKWGKLACVQGFLVLEDIEEGDVALQVLRGAHRHHRKFMTRTGEEPKTDWYKFRNGDLDWFDAKDCKPHSVYCKAGSFVLWDSRIPHQAKRDLAYKSKHDRYVIYVCMVPRSWCTEKKLKARQKAFETGRATSHWPQEAKLFAAVPRWADKTLYHFDQEKQLRIRDSKVSDPELMRKLVGY